MYGTGPEALATHLTDNWQVSRTGREDVPDVVSNPQTETGVVITTNRNLVKHMGAHQDTIHLYHPTGGSIDVEDSGYKEQNVTESVQIDIDLLDRNAANGDRLGAKERMVGDRAEELTTRSNAGIDNDDPPYPGIFGEVKYLLETVRRGLDEYEKVSHTVLTLSLENSNAVANIDVEMERLADNTVQ